MQITFLGHAGFFVETTSAIIIMDAWVSKYGAFDGGWFQLPQNHHMATWVTTKITATTKPVYIYISHEHKDHFDIDFIKTVKGNISFVIPAFRRTLLQTELQQITTYPINVLGDNETMVIPGGQITIFTDDSEMDRDSAILLEADEKKFLNLNDCKIFDRLIAIKKQYTHIDVMAVQFSGATWHPTCYDYSIEQYEAISIKKKTTKFFTAAKAIYTIKPTYYIPSAGPACFLDPATIHINFQPQNIFPRVPEFLAYLYDKKVIDKEFSKELMPGDCLDTIHNNYVLQSNTHYNTNFEDYIHNYAAEYTSYFELRNKPFIKEALLDIQQQLQTALQQKLNGFSSRSTIERNLFIAIKEIEYSFIKVDFINGAVHTTTTINDTQFYTLESSANEFYRILQGLQTWEDFSLTFRMRLNRAPDAYQSLIHGFLILEIEDMEHLCEKFKAFENNEERITVEVNNTIYTVNRYCPHQGADMKEATIEGDRYLVCPRHGWKFDLQQQGRCTTAICSLEAKHYEPE
jgi:UDP-MurNAc hydroxylase